MRLTLLAAVAAAALGSFAPSAGATCMTIYDKGDWYSYSCSAPGGPPRTTTCHRPTGLCVTY